MELIGWLVVGGLGWLASLTGVVVFLWSRVRRLQEDFRASSRVLEQIGHDLSGLRADLARLASAQQVADSERRILEAVEVRLARRPRKQGGGVAFGDGTQITGPVAGHDVGA